MAQLLGDTLKRLEFEPMRKCVRDQFLRARSHTEAQFSQVGQIPFESFGFFTPRPFEALLRSTLSGFSFEFLQFQTHFTRRADFARLVLM